MGKVTINKTQKLFVIPGHGGYSCLGFDVLERRAKALALELDCLWGGTTRGTLAAYKAYQKLLNIAREKNNKTGWRSKSELTPQLVGLEGKRIEVVDAYGDTRRFQVGRSTGFIPIHLEIYNRRSLGGGSVTGAPFKSIKIIRSQ